MDLAQAFLTPSNTAHRQYEALRAYFVDNMPGPEVAARFGYTIGSFHQLVHQFRQSPDRKFFRERERTTTQAADVIRLRIIQLRKQNLSVYDISEALKKEDISRTPVAIAELLRKEGFAKLPRRRDDERPATNRPTAADRADVRSLDLEPRSFRTKFGGLFLFLPALVEMSFNRVIGYCGLPGSEAIPAAHALRSLLALKLFGTQRHMHVMSAVLDEGLALFAGLNVIPKRSFLAEYSSRIAPESYPKLLRHWFNAVRDIGLEHGESFDLDFHTVPFHGEDPLLEKHYVSKRSRSQKGILAFLAQDGEKRCFCYGRCDIRREEQAGEIIRFAEFWRDRTGEYPRELIFDSRLTTHSKLNELNHKQIFFITLRKRTPKLMEELNSRPRSAWRKIELSGVSRMYRSPKILDDNVRITDYDEPIRQITVNDLGHEEPTLLLTNHLRGSPAKLVERYAHRMLIENNIEDSINFFHMDALTSAVALKVNCDLQLTLMASSLYRHFAQRLGNGYESAKSRHLFRDFIDATAEIHIRDGDIVVQYQKRAHNPLLVAAGFAETDTPVPWLRNTRLRFLFG
jgi:transposase